jgi:hypothetical protein
MAQHRRVEACCCALAPVLQEGTRTSCGSLMPGRGRGRAWVPRYLEPCPAWAHACVPSRRRCRNCRKLNLSCLQQLTCLKLRSGATRSLLFPEWPMRNFGPPQVNSPRPSQQQRQNKKRRVITRSVAIDCNLRGMYNVHSCSRRNPARTGKMMSRGTKGGGRVGSAAKGRRGEAI